MVNYTPDTETGHGDGDIKCKRTLMSKVKAHSRRAKVEAKAKAKFFYDVCRSFFDLCLLVFSSFSLSLGVNRPLVSIKLVNRTWFSLEQVFGL